MKREMFQLAGAVLGAVFVAFFAFLALDLAWRVWVTRATFDSRLDVALIVGLETVRALVTVVVAATAVAVARRPEPGHGALAVTLLCAALWYAKATTFGFPGFFQERLALWLMDAGASRDVLRWVFGRPAWALAPAAGAFLAFALRYPSAPDAGAVRDVHATGRRGMMRGVALAGTDVRSLLHRAAGRVLETDLLTPRVIAAGSVAAAIALSLGGPVARTVTGLGLLAAVLLGLAFLRTAWVVHEGAPRHRLRGLARAAAAAFTGLVASAGLGFVPGAAVAQAALVLSSLAPLVAALLLTTLARAQPAA